MLPREMLKLHISLQFNENVGVMRTRSDILRQGLELADWQGHWDKHQLVVCVGRPGVSEDYIMPFDTFD